MCFSPEASFIASGGIGIVGIASTRIARGTQRFLAAIPLLFALQQLFEGMQWLALRAGSISVFFLYGFLFFALILWPVYIPYAVYRCDIKQRPLMRWFLMFGSIASVSFLSVLLLYGADALEVNRSIQYHFKGLFGLGGTLIYMLITVGPLVLSSVKAFRWFGYAVVSAIGIAYLFYSETFISVWCFFAAILSTLIFLYLRRENKN